MVLAGPLMPGLAGSGLIMMAEAFAAQVKSKTATASFVAMLPPKFMVGSSLECGLRSNDLRSERLRSRCEQRVRLGAPHSPLFRVPLQGRLAISVQFQVDQLLFQALAVVSLQRRGQFFQQHLGKLLAGAVQHLPHSDSG